MSTVEIKYNGTDITNDVFVEGTTFESRVNGGIGSANLRVKDRAHTYNFISGGTLTLDVDGNRIWSGLIVQARKTFALPVMDTTDPVKVARMWDLVGLDYNLLFAERVVMLASNPIGKLDFSYAVGTYDDTIINDIFDHYLTIGSDGLSRSNVDRIAIAILDLPGTASRGSITSAGQTWKDTMDRIRRVTGAVYYISPTKVLHYHDVETPTSTYTLTDQPNGANDVGYQKVTLLNDGTKLVNDVMIWGTSNGVDHWVISRIQDSASIAAHGRWQHGELASVYRQASADFIANTWVYGTPQSHRGGKDDARTFTVRVFEPKFRAGDVVPIEFNIFGYTESLPIRKMLTSFVNQDTPIFDLTLSYDIDSAYTFYEYQFPRIKVTTCPDGYYMGPAGKCIPIPGGTPPPPGPKGCDETICGITDTFSRSVSAGWGTSDAGIAWTVDFQAHTNASSVDGSAGVISVGAGAGGSSWADRGMTLRPGLALEYPITMSGKFKIGSNVSTGHVFFPFWISHSGALADTSIGPEIYCDPTSSSGYISIPCTDDDGDRLVEPIIAPDGVSVGSTSYRFTIAANVWYHLKIQLASPTLVQFRAWTDGQPEPSTWGSFAISNTTPFTGPDVYFGSSIFNVDTTGSYMGWLDDFDVEGINGCGATQFDNFERTVPNGGWGLATPSGRPWIADPFFDEEWLFVNGGRAHFAPPSGGALKHAQPYIHVNPGDGAPWQNGAFTFTTQFDYDVLPSGTDYLSFEVMALDDTATNGPLMYAQVGAVGNQFIGTGTYAGGAGNITDLAFTFADFGPRSYKVVWEYTPHATCRLKIWNTADPEPSTWLIDKNISGLDTSSLAAHPSDLIVDVWGRTTALSNSINFDYMDFDYDGRPCIVCNRGSGAFDNFDNRTIALADDYTGWGTPSSGVEPYNADVLYFGLDSHTQIGVAGGVGQVRSALREASLFNFYPNILGVRSFNFTNWQLTMPENTYPLPIVYELRFRINGTLPGDVMTPNGLCSWTLNILWNATENTTVELGINPHTPNTTDWDGSGKGGQFTIWGPSSGGFAPDCYRHKTDWEADVWYHLRVEGGLSTSRAWLWKEGDSMGTPLVMPNALPAYSRGYNELSINANDGVYSTWPDVPYEGSIDDFYDEPENTWPTISIDIDYLTWNPPFGLAGPCSGGCQPQVLTQYDTFQRTISQGFGTNDRASAWTNQYVSGAYGVDGNFLYAGDGTTGGVVALYNADISLFSGDFILEASFFTNVLHTGASIGPSIWNYGLRMTDASYSAWVQFTYFATSGGKQLQLNHGGSSINVTVPFTAGEAYKVKWDTRIGAKMWREADGEPATWNILQPTTPGPIDTFYLATQGGDATTRAFTNYILVTPFECGIVAEGGTSLPTSGHVCETINFTGTAAMFNTSRAFVEGTLDIWVNGIRQSVQTYQGSTGVFTTLFPLTAGEDKLYVCYTANGALE